MGKPRGFKPHVISLPKDETHWFLMDAAGQHRIADPTAGALDGEPIPYNRAGPDWVFDYKTVKTGPYRDGPSIRWKGATVVINQLITDKALAKREEWETCAPNAYQQMDLQVLDMITEIRLCGGPGTAWQM